jgi:RNA polymerase sigma factor (sigma-70 family)
MRPTPTITDTVDDTALVQRAVDGDKEALAALVGRHQSFVFNVALKMFGDRADAEDLTQEVLVKAITSLRSFRGDAAFRTWLYRIAVNHFLQTRRRGMELVVGDFASYFDALDRTPDAVDPAFEPEPDGDERPLAGSTVAELRVRCTTGMLMCLDRDQRVTFILGALFGIDHTLAAEVLGISPGNFRVRLHRARADLFNWMNRRCGLVNRDNPCRCHRKARAYVDRGVVDPIRREFTRDYTSRIGDMVEQHAGEVMATVDDLHQQVFRDHPVQVTRASVVEEVLAHPVLADFFDLSPGTTQRPRHD